MTPPGSNSRRARLPGPGALPVRAILAALAVALAQGATAAPFHRAGDYGAIRVPADFPTIGAALAAAGPSGRVAIAPGTYVESGLVLPSRALVYGEGPDSSAVVIESPGPGEPILSALSGSGQQIRGLTFRSGDASEGGAIRSQVFGSFRILGCRFEGNRASVRGGAIRAGTLTLEDCEFVDNVSGSEGGAVYTSGELTVARCTFRRNHATLTGGAINASGGRISTSLFEANSATYAGGVLLHGSVDRCIFDRNTASADGGGLLLTGRDTRASLCRFVANTAAHQGGGLRAKFGGPTIESCTFLGNGAVAGGGISTEDYEPRFLHCVIQGSTSGGATHQGGTSLPYVEHCDFHGNAGGDWSAVLSPVAAINGNFSADGLFCDAPAESLGVAAVSPLLATNNEWGVDVGAEAARCEAQGVVVTTIPPGLALEVDGAPVQGPAVFDWSPGSLHTIGTSAVFSANGIRREFTGWSDGGAVTHDIVAPFSPATFLASFAPSYLLTVNADPHGSVTPATGWQPQQSTVTLRQTPDPEYITAGWAGEGLGAYTGPGDQVTVRMRGPITETALFLFNGYYPVTIAAEGGGSVTPESGSYHANYEVTIRATCPPEYRFDGWVGTGEGSYTGPDSVAVIRILDPIVQTARFHYEGYELLTMEVVGSGLVTPGTGPILRDVPQLIDAQAFPGYSFHRWVGEGEGSYTGEVRSAVVRPLGPISETAYFAEDGKFPVTVTADPQGVVNPPSGNYTAGSTLSLGAIPHTGWRFVEWQGTGPGSYSGPAAYAEVTVHGPIEQRGVFEPDGEPHGYELSISASATDPFDTTEPPAGGPRPLYLWLTCSELGMSAFEAGVQFSIVLSDFVTGTDVVNFGYGTDLLLGVIGCPTGENVARLLGSWTALDTGGQVWLTTSRVNGTFGAVDCGAFPSLWPDPLVRGFSSSGPAPVTGENGCGGIPGGTPEGMPARAGVPPWIAPLVTTLSSVAPNPFRGETEMRFSLAAPGHAKLTVYDLSGRLVHSLRDGELPAGEYRVSWNGRVDAGRVAAGIYFVRFEAGGRRQTERVVFLGAR